MNKSIEKIQNEIGLFLMEIIPVEWKRICLYAECEDGHNSYWGCFQEKITALVVTSEFFYDRYKDYVHTEREVQNKLFDLLYALYEEYQKEYGENVWKTMIFVVEENGKYSIDFGYDFPKNSISGILSHRKSLSNKYFGKDYKYTTEKYPY